MGLQQNLVVHAQEKSSIEMRVIYRQLVIATKKRGLLVQNVPVELTRYQYKYHISSREAYKEGVYLAIQKNLQVFWRENGGAIYLISRPRSNFKLSSKYLLKKVLFPSPDLNPGPSDYEAAVLLTELHCQTEN